MGTRREEEYEGRKVLEMAVPGRRKHGTPKRRKIGTVREDMQGGGAEEEDTGNWKRLRESTGCVDRE